jgi:hypothetical protein
MMAADGKTASLRSCSFTDVHKCANFGLLESLTVHGRSPTFAGVGVKIGVKSISSVCYAVMGHRPVAACEQTRWSRPQNQCTVGVLAQGAGTDA